jgi:chromosome condensin MukBEF complex kleisin-like MukF subunit
MLVSEERCKDFSLTIPFRQVFIIVAIIITIATVIKLHTHIWKTLQVKTKMINSAGADVIQHMIDNFEP